MDLICLCPRPCAKVFERDREPWWTKPVVWREIDRENIKKRLRKTREIFVNQTNQKWWQTNQFNHKKKCNRFIYTIELEFKKEMNIYWKLWIFCSFCNYFPSLNLWLFRLVCCSLCLLCSLGSLTLIFTRCKSPYYGNLLSIDICIILVVQLPIVTRPVFLSADSG